MVRDATRGRANAVILARFQGVYLAESGLASGIRGPGHIEIITRAQGEAVVRQVEQLRPPQIFVGKQYLESDDTNPYRTLLPLLAQDYSVTAATTGGELRLYTLRSGPSR